MLCQIHASNPRASTHHTAATTREERISRSTRAGQAVLQFASATFVPSSSSSGLGWNRYVRKLHRCPGSRVTGHPADASAGLLSTSRRGESDRDWDERCRSTVEHGPEGLHVRQTLLVHGDQFLLLFFYITVAIYLHKRIFFLLEIYRTGKIGNGKNCRISTKILWTRKISLLIYHPYTAKNTVELNKNSGNGWNKIVSTIDVLARLSWHFSTGGNFFFKYLRWIRPE